jgi:hypothetical protein
MKEENQELFFDLLTKKAVYGLDDVEQQQFDALDPEAAEIEFRSLEKTAAAISMVGIETDEPLPAHLSSRIAANADRFVGAAEAETASAWSQTRSRTIESNDVFTDEPTRSWFSWFGWAVAAAACVALIANLWLTRLQPNIDVAGNQPPANGQTSLTTAELRDEMLHAATDVIQAAWAVGNVKGITQLVGDVVWSDQRQAGYMRFRGLPVNNAGRETYQIWIFDKTRDPNHPIDGGTFDVSADGEIVIPINPKLKAQKPEMFAVTVEKPGGVVVSTQEKVAATAKIETKPS